MKHLPTHPHRRQATAGATNKFVDSEGIWRVCPIESYASVVDGDDLTAGTVELAVVAVAHEKLIILTVQGSIDIRTAPQLTDAVAKALTAEPNGLIIDLTATEFLASAGTSSGQTGLPLRCASARTNPCWPRDLHARVADVSGNLGAGQSENDNGAAFDESMVIEFSFQIFATACEAAQYASALSEALAPIFKHVGHYAGPRTALTSTADGQLDETHSASHRRRKPEQNLFDVSIAVRGRGDRNELSDAVFHAVKDAQLDFEQMTEGYFEGHYLHHGLNTYPTLRSHPNTVH